MSKVQFKDWLCDVKYAKYGNGSTAIALDDAKEGDPVAVASVNFSNKEGTGLSDVLPKNQCYIKTWSENSGILGALEGAGIVRSTGQTATTGPYNVISVLVEIIDPDFQIK